MYNKQPHNVPEMNGTRFEFPKNTQFIDPFAAAAGTAPSLQALFKVYEDNKKNCVVLPVNPGVPVTRAS